METDASDYVLVAILSIINKENEVHLVAFHSYTFTTVKLNYDMHNKEFIAIFEAFKIWRYYLEGPAYPIDIVTDHENLGQTLVQNLQLCRQSISENGYFFVRPFC